MNLPHLDPIKFAQKVLRVDQKKAQVVCRFPFAPSLAMMFEAAAQSSAAFSNEGSKIGFVVSLKNLELIEKSTSLEVLVNLSLNMTMGNISEVDFEVSSMDEKQLFSQGTLTVMLQE